MFLASLAGRVKRIRLGTGTVNLPNIQGTLGLYNEQRNAVYV